MGFHYDLNGNQVEQISPKGLKTSFAYDELNRLTKKIDSLGGITQFSYDGVDNLAKMVDPKATVWAYEYYPNNLLKKAELTGADNSTYYVAYTYDEAGNRKTVTDSGNRIENNLHNGIYRPDPLNRIHSIDRYFDGATYRTEYQYEKPALLTAIKYPETDTWLEYKYNSQHQLGEVVGFTDPAGIEYDQNGAF